MRDIDLAGEAAIATAPVAEAVLASFGALLADRDVAEIGSLEGGSVEVLRRGRRERLDVILEGPLFALLRECGAETAVLTLRLPQGHELVCGPLADGRIALRVVKATVLDATLDALVEEGVLPAGVELELRAAVLEGAGVLVIGPARAARRRVLAALVRSLADRLSLFGMTDSLSSLLPVPLVKGAALLDKARAGASLGCDALCGLDLTPREAAELARAELGVPFVLAVAVPSMDALVAALAEHKLVVSALAGTTAVIGHGADGQARLVELHGPTRLEGSASPPRTASGTAGSVGSAGSAGSAGATGAMTTMLSRGLPPMAPAEVSGVRQRPTFASERRDSSEDSVTADAAHLPALAQLPEAWASDHADDDPGWELGDTPGAPPAPGSFDAALASQKRKPSPGGAPVRADPFGGLTLEPPPGGRADDDEESR